MEIQLVFSRKDLCAVVVLSFILLLTTPPLFGVRSIYFGNGYTFVVFSDGSISLLSPIAVILIAIGTTILHESIHMVTLKVMEVSFKLKSIKLFRLPLIIQVDYDKIEIWQYILTALSPQILTLVLVSITYFVNYAPLVMSAVLNFASSSGDFYGIAKTLIKTRSIRGTIFRVDDLRYVIRID